MDFRNLELNCRTVESFFDHAGHVPVVSTLTGAVRILGGNSQVLFGTLMAAVNFACFLGSEGETSKACVDEAWRSLEFAMNGLGNVTRGAIEVFPLINMLTIAFDLIGLRIPYHAEYETVTSEMGTQTDEELLQAPGMVDSAV